MNRARNRPHQPVLVQEVLEGFAEVSLSVFYEGTLGAAGHAQEILKAHPEIKRYIACDLDQEALALARKQLEPWKEKVDLIHGNFMDLDAHLEERGIQEVDGFFLI
ncbi:MAG TPA: 16S rRNA (cytosine(1402)-N(4))-methyltransferase [Rhabdochlamydiaceae bacterium]|nr:16S rRNA (cytosine(1402)-N(4))-methyltransferase [Rhabdochlamydiaceae bacterium]